MLKAEVKLSTKQKGHSPPQPPSLSPHTAPHPPISHPTPAPGSCCGWSRPCLTQEGLRTQAAARPAFPGSLLPHEPHFSCFYKQWHDLQIYKSINGLYSPIIHFNNTRSCLWRVDSRSLVPKGRVTGVGARKQGQVEAVRRPRSFSSGFSYRAFPAGPLRGLAGLHHLSGSPLTFSGWHSGIPGTVAPGALGK